MKQTINSLLFVTALSGTALLTGCTIGERGDPGPQGPAGNANVISTTTVTIHPGDWTSGGSDYYYDDLSISAITPDVVDDGAVFMYYEIANNEWMMLPYLQGALYIQNSFYDYGAMIEVSTVDGTPVVFTGPLTFRVIIIPSGVRRANPNTNWNNYKEVEQLIQKNDIKTNVIKQN